MIYLESPANPTNALVDVEAVRDARDAALGANCPIAIDNTFLGPLPCAITLRLLRYGGLEARA